MEISVTCDPVAAVMITQTPHCYQSPMMYAILCVNLPESGGTYLSRHCFRWWCEQNELGTVDERGTDFPGMRGSYSMLGVWGDPRASWRGLTLWESFKL